MRLIVFIILLILSFSCTHTKIENNQEIGLKDKNYIDSFQNLINNFEKKRYYTYGNDMNVFLVENAFSESLKKDFKNIPWLQVKVWSNFYDTNQQRREMLLIDTNTNVFNAITPDTGYFKNVQSFSNAQVKGTMLGFKMIEDTANPNLEVPNFYIYVDSLRILKK